mmetsp:Transcript_8720/g.28770  ORF Transcript_8720/g.28770 Transcript_8720/m.28770 type:complete len:169 (-) Transcript_8720:21-527(-)
MVASRSASPHARKSTCQPLTASPRHSQQHAGTSGGIVLGRPSSGPAYGAGLVAGPGGGGVGPGSLRCHVRAAPGSKAPRRSSSPTSHLGFSLEAERAESGSLSCAVCQLPAAAAAPHPFAANPLEPAAQVVVAVLVCGHVFHPECLASGQEREPSCPKCGGSRSPRVD